MSYILRKVLRCALFPVRLTRRFPVRTAAFTVVVLAVVAGGGYAFVVREWKRATAAFAADQPTECRAHLSPCLWLWSGDYDVHLLAAKAARLTGDLTAAVDHLKQCRQIRDGATEEVQIEHLLIRVQQGEGEEAAGPLFALVEANHPQSGYILYTIARVYMVQMRYRYALASLSMWAEVDPTNPLIYPLRGAVLERLEEPRAALADYEKAVELSPEAFPPRLRLAEMLIEDKKTPDAIKHLELLMTTHPHRPEVRARLGMCRYYQGRKEEARRLMESALPEMPNDPVLLVALARLDIQDHDGVAAEKRLKDLIAKDHAEEEGRFLLVTALRLQGRDADADVAQRDSERVRGLNERLTKLLRDQVDTANAGPDVWCEIGGVLLQLGLDKRAFAWFDRALDRDPNHQPTHRVLIGYYEKKGEADNADKHRRYLR